MSLLAHATIADRLAMSAKEHNALRLDVSLITALSDIARAMHRCLTERGRVYLCGNGGSAADAQHVAAELQGRFMRERQPYPAIALTTDTSILTAIGNDYGYEHVFARQVAANARAGDIVVGISTSGNSRNVLNALATARVCEAITVGFTGAEPGHLRDLSDVLFCAPSRDTARIQELHMSAWHAVIDAVEAGLP